MTDLSSMGHVRDALLPAITIYDDLGLEKPLSLAASPVFVGVFLLQFFSIYRHGAGMRWCRC